MVAVHLLDNFAGPWETHGAPYGDTYDVGLSFSVTENVEINALRWYWRGSGYVVPTQIALWRRTDSLRLELLTGLTAPAAAGWKDEWLPATRTLIAGVSYSVVARFPASSGWADKLVSSPPEAPAPFVWSDLYRTWQQAPTTELPSNQDSGLLAGVDVGTGDAVGPPPGGTGDPTVTGDLADWLDTQTGTQENSAPLDTHAEVTHASHGLAVLGELIGDVLEDAGNLLARVPSTLAATLTTIKDAVTIGPLPGIVGLENLANNVLDTLETAAQYLANPSGGSIGALRNTPAVPGTGWTLIDTTAFTFQKSWDVAADLYVLSSSNYPPNFPLQDVDGAPWRPRAGWWAVRNGDAMLGRQFVDWDVQHLVDGGRRMPGVVVRLQPGVEATLEAWRLT